MTEWAGHYAPLSPHLLTACLNDSPASFIRLPALPAGSDQALDFLLRFQQAVLVDYSDNRFSAFAYIRPTNKATAEAHPGLGPLHVKVKGQWAGG